MSRLHETSPLLQYPSAAITHFQPAPPVARQPYQALHIQHRNNLIQQQQRERVREQQQQQQQQQERQQQQHKYTFAPHESSLLYDHDDEEASGGSDGGSEDGDSGGQGGEDSLKLQRVEHSTHNPTDAASSLTNNNNNSKQQRQRNRQRKDVWSAGVDGGNGSRAGGAVAGAGAANGSLGGGSELAVGWQTLGPFERSAYGSTAQTTGAAAANGSRGESQSQPQSPCDSSLRPGSGYQSSATQQGQQQARHDPTHPTVGGMGGVKDLGYTPSSSPTPSLLFPSSHPVRLALYLILSVVIAVANAITWKRTLNRFRATDGSSSNLEFFVTEWTILLYVLLAAVILAYRWLFTALISDEQKAYPQSKFALMGLMDAVAGLCSSLGGAFTSGQTQVILNQANIPVTMLLSRSFLSSNYTLTQYIGAALIVGGSLLAAVPSTGGSEASGSSSGSSSNMWYGPLILLLSCLPNSFSNVYKEKNFKQDGLDVYFLTTLVSLWQVVLGFLFCPILSLPGLGGLSLSAIPNNFSQGWSCFPRWICGRLRLPPVASSLRRPAAVCGGTRTQHNMAHSSHQSLRRP